MWTAPRTRASTLEFESSACKCPLSSSRVVLVPEASTLEFKSSALG